MTIHMSEHDLGSWLLADDQRQFINEALEEGRYLTEEDLKPFEKTIGRVEVKGVASACPTDSPAWKRSLARQRGEEWTDEFAGESRQA